MITSDVRLDVRDLVHSEIHAMLGGLGQGRTLGTAYDTAWGARLASRYPGRGFEDAAEWLRRNQHEDGSWGGALEHNHDRYISTLAAVVALKEVGTHSRDARRVKRGEAALWKLVGRLGRDDSDTVGFPILAAALADEADRLHLDVPRAPVRYAQGYRKKVDALFNMPVRNWLSTSLTYSFEALRDAAHAGDRVLESNGSVSISPSATAAYLLWRDDASALAYLQTVAAQEGDGSLPAASPIDLFETAWVLNQLHAVGAISAADPDVRRSLDRIWVSWSPERGVSASTYWQLPDIDDTGACFLALHWGGYPVSSEVFDAFETDDYFCTYPGETNPSLSAHLRLLAALNSPRHAGGNHRRIEKVVAVLQRMDPNGSFWWDKWHASPYYVTGAAVVALDGIADELALTRLKWILRTQNEDGGWGYLGRSTAEETAYCLRAMLHWQRRLGSLDESRIAMAARFLLSHLADEAFAPMWIAKSLYTPFYPVKAAVLSTAFDYLDWSSKI